MIHFLNFFILTSSLLVLRVHTEISSSSLSSSSDDDFDPRNDVRYKEILLSGCTAEKHLNFHDVDPYEIAADKFKMKCISEMRADPTCETREVYDKVRLEFTEKMSDESA